MKDKELKRCPFCGGTAQMNINAGMKPKYGFITCHKCNAAFTLNHTNDPEKVWEAWNQRAANGNGEAASV